MFERTPLNTSFAHFEQKAGLQILAKERGLYPAVALIVKLISIILNKSFNILTSWVLLSEKSFI